MKKSFRHLSLKTKERAIKVADGISSVACLLFIFRAVSLADLSVASSVAYLVVNLLLAVSCLLQACAAYRKDRIVFIKNLCFSAVWALAGTVVAVLGITRLGSMILIESLLAILLANCIIKAVTAAKKRYMVLFILLAIFIGYIAVDTLLENDDTVAMLILLHALIIFLKVLGHIIAISFSQIRLGVLRKILRKTFAAEILFGLLLLVVAFSFVFLDMEPGIHTYLDALWYCFAVVTTIGFGDITVVTPFSRVLSMILGCYGIIVVALITSVIVNFYNEVKNDADADDVDAPVQRAENAPLPEREDTPR